MRAERRAGKNLTRTAIGTNRAESPGTYGVDDLRDGITRRRGGRMPPRMGAAQRAPRLKGYATVLRRSARPLLRGELRPASRVHVAQRVLLPGEFGMPGQMFGRLEVAPAGVAQQRGERHLLRAGRVRHFVLHRAGRRVGRLPRPHAARRGLDVPAECALAGIHLAGEAVEVIAQEVLRGAGIDLAFVLLHQRQPTFMARVLAPAAILGVEIGLLLDQSRIVGWVSGSRRTLSRFVGGQPTKDSSVWNTIRP